MKKFTLFLLLISLTNLLSAQNESKTYHEKMKILMSELNTSNFKNNTLYDKVYPLARLKEFNQNGVKDTSNYKHFYQSVQELYFASNKQNIISPDYLKQLSFNAKDQNQILIGIINMDISFIKEDSFDQNDKKITIDSTNQIKKLIEIPNKNPYEQKQVLVISPLSKTIQQITGQGVIFNFKDALAQDTDNPIKNLSVDFGNGQVQNIITNGSFTNEILTYTFTTVGKKTFKFTGVFQNDNTFDTSGSVNVIFCTNCPPIHKLRAPDLFTPYEDDTPYIPNYVSSSIIDEHPEIEYTINYSTNPPREILKKPIIIVDGIDYDDERDCYGIFENALELKDTNENLGVKLQELGYDVIICNFPNYQIAEYTYDINNMGSDTGGYQILGVGVGNPPVNVTSPSIITHKIFRQGGADYIQRNAKAVQELIRTVNDSLVINNSTEKLVVVGPSMGGLVTRWALKEMENNGEDHNTRLWLSFDSPHQGANVPIGLQFGASYQGQYSSLDVLRRNATKQMLVYHYLDESNNTVSQGAPNFRNRFKNELNTLGFPNNLRKVALVNGGVMAQTINTQNECFVHTDIRAIGRDLFTGQYFAYDAHIRFTKDYGLQTVFELDHPSFINTVGGADGEDVIKKVFNNYQTGSYDNAPGCMYVFDDDDLLTSENWEWESRGPWFAGFRFYTFTTQLKNNFSFMPTKSTLDFHGTTKILNEALCYDLVSAGETPFDSYYAPLHNEPHVELNSANVAWLLNELASPTPTAPITYCNYTIEIDGSDTQCPNQVKTYVLNHNNLSNVVWSVSSNLTIIPSATNNQQIKVMMNETVGTDIWANITANVNGVIVEKYITCDDVYPMYKTDYVENHNIIINLKDIENKLPISQQNITDVQWELTSGNGQLIETTFNNATVRGSNFTGKVTVTNAKGAVTQNFFWPNPGTCYSLTKIGIDKYQVINRCQNNEIVDTLPIKELYDIYGNKIGDIPINNQDLDINNLGNTGTINILRVKVNGENITKKIIKE